MNAKEAKELVEEYEKKEQKFIDENIDIDKDINKIDELVASAAKDGKRSVIYDIRDFSKVAVDELDKKLSIEKGYKIQYASADMKVIKISW